MRIPQRPPTQDKILEKLREDPARVSAILDALAGPTHAGEYLHWDKLRRLEPPTPLSKAEWWYGLKLRRRAMSHEVALTDKRGVPFSFAVIDPLLEAMHVIDRSAGGGVHIPEPVLNPETQRQYLVRSLVEESITSSQLEGAATTREVAKEMLREGRPPRDTGERMILNNYQTMQAIAAAKGRPLCRDLVFELHRTITAGTLRDSSGAGRFRRASERVVVSTPEEEVLHDPPAAEELGTRMELMCQFANAQNDVQFMHPVLRAMILHFWLAYDHPFVDGNGRAARALFYWSMLNSGYWLTEFISISEIILKAPVQYGRAFLYTETDENDLTYFLVYHTEVVRRAIKALYDYVESRSRQREALEARLRGLSALNERQRDLVSHALRHAGQRYTVESHRHSHGVVYETARMDLLNLVERGLLTSSKRGKTWQFAPVQDLEARLRRLE